jgi:DNA-directed RNA polymerase specialized sigma24 family protein
VKGIRIKDFRQVSAQFPPRDKVIAAAVVNRCRALAAVWIGSGGDRGVITSDEFLWDAFSIARERFVRYFRKREGVSKTIFAYRCARGAVSAVLKIHVTHRFVKSRGGRVEVQSITPFIREESAAGERRFVRAWASTSGCVPADASKRLEAAVAALDPLDRACLLTHVGGASFAEIARDLGCTREAIGARWKRVIRNLRAELTRKEIAPVGGTKLRFFSQKVGSAATSHLRA